MTPIQAFVGHSFAEDDAIVVGKFLRYLDQIAELRPDFSWEHAEPAEPRAIDAKVLDLFANKNLFIAICTKKERVIAPSALRNAYFQRDRLTAREKDFDWKTSDWIIQEIGLAVGRGLNVILLVEQGVKSPGALQGNLERIEFEREAPEKVFGKLIEMISALAPHGSSTASAEAESMASPPEADESSQPPGGNDWLTVKPEWKRQDYEFALMHFLIVDDKASVQTINDKYLSTELGAQEHNRKTWDAFKEYIGLQFAKGGSLSLLTRLADENSDIWEISVYLARIYRKYEEYGKAAEAFQRAAGVAGDIHKHLELLGEAACALQRANLADAALALVERMRTKCADAGQGEADLLLAMRKLSEITHDDEMFVGTMERQLELNPVDTDTRFALAYKYSEQGNDALAALHYSKISYDARKAVAWNNLGVAFERMGLHGKSVSAYRKSEEMGETLAMSNLANKLIGIGFISEAGEICEEALKLKEIHKNVGSTLTRLKEMPEEEDKKEADAFDKVRPISEFYRDFGRAITRPPVTSLVARWKGPDCILDLELSESALTATGSYEHTVARGLLSLSSILSGVGTPDKSDGETVRHRVVYNGIAEGYAVVGSVVREKDGVQSKSALLSGSVEDRLTVLMVVSDDGSEIRVLEKAKTGSPRFYILKPC